MQIFEKIEIVDESQLHQHPKVFPKNYLKIFFRIF